MRCRCCEPKVVAFLIVSLSLLGACGEDGDAGQGAAHAGGQGGVAGSGNIAGSGGGDGLGGRGGDGGGAMGAGGAGGELGGGGAGGVPQGGFGIIDGLCGVLDAPELTGSASEVFENSLDFEMMPFDYDALSVGGQKVFDDGNLGGNSLHSEIFAYEMLYRCELATLLKTEGEVEYQDAMGKKTDLIVSIDAFTIGVSVTRAVSFPPDDPYPVSQAQALLEDKLADVQLSSANVKPVDAWSKQILLIMAYGDEHAMSLQAAYSQIDASTKADTLVLVTVTHGEDDFIYF